jgi:hypothetical protein
MPFKEVDPDKEKTMRRCLPPSFLLVLPWLTTVAAAQVSRSAQVVAPTVLPTITPAAVGTATLAGVDQLSLPPGTKAYVQSSAPAGIPNGPSSGLLYRFEQRDGRTTLVETTYERVTNYYGVPSLKPTGEWLYPGDTKLVYTGPWVTGTFGMGLKQVNIIGLAAYLLRPLDVAARRVMPRAGITAAATLVAGAVAPPKSGKAVKTTTTVALAKPQPLGQDCGVKFNPESLGDANQIHGLVCLLLTQDGQGMTLPDGTRLFRRYGEIEHWKGDTVIDRSYGVVARDAQGRYWFLEPKGWL